MRMRTAAVIGTLAVSACGDGRAGENAAPSASVAAALGPRVSLSAEGVFLDGARVADAPKDALRVVALSDALRPRREAWRHDPDTQSKPFPGVVEVELPADTSCQSALAVLRACSHGGFPNAFLTMGGARSRLGLSDPDLLEPTGPTARLWFRADGLVELRKQKCLSSYATVAPHDMVPHLKKLLHDSKLSIAQIGCEPGVRFVQVVGPFAENAAGWPTSLIEPMLLSFAAPCPEGGAPAPLDPATVKAAMTVGVIQDKQALGEKRIEAAVELLRPKLLGCYGHRPAKTKPGLRTSLLLRLEIGDTGVVTSGYATNSLEPFPFEAVQTCVDREAGSLKLDPPPPAFSDVEVRLEFQER